MKTSFLRRCIALFLCCQPVLWQSQVALAQTLSPTLTGASPPVDQGDPVQRGAAASGQAPSGLQDGDPFRSERSASPFGTPGLSSYGAPGLSSGAPGLSSGAPGVPALAPGSPLVAPGSAFAATTPPAVDAPIDPDAYVCGPGDVLDLHFWGLQNFRVRATIDLEGRAFVPRLGHFDLRGKTLSAARRELGAVIARNYPKLGFDLVLAEPRTFLVQIVDAVRRPGSYPARAVDRLATVIARAGGLAPNGSQRRIQVRRRDGTVLQPDLLLFGLTGDVAYNPYLLDGDVVRVPFEDLGASIGGAVNRPGRYELVGTKDLAELVTLAGGFSASATRLLPLSMVRRLPDARSEQRLVELTEGPPPALTLQHEDVVHVPSVSELQRSVMIIGAIAAAAATRSGTGTTPDEGSATRRVAFVQGDSVRTLLERVGGVGPLADLEGAYILRAGRALPVNLEALLVRRDLSADHAIELGDSVVIPFKRRNVLVEGAVFKPGEYPYNPSYGVPEYLSLAGGRNRFALDESEVRVVTSAGKTMEYRRDLRIDPGSTLVVPERHFSRAEVVQIALGVASVLVSGVAVMLAARR